MTIGQNLTSIPKIKVFLGHQSVGTNIIDGMQSILGENHFPIIDLENRPELARNGSPYFAHGKIGQNKSPLAKIQHFGEILDTHKAEEFDAAGFKFCYIDVDNESDVKQLLKQYQLAIERLELTFPKMVFFHTTVPLTTYSGRFIDRTFRRPWAAKIRLADNHTRNIFNSEILKRYKGKAPIFDLAYYESTLSTGKRSIYRYNGADVPVLSSEYSSDGGHLNKLGRQFIAQKFLNFLTECCR